MTTVLNAHHARMGRPQTQTGLRTECIRASVFILSVQKGLISRLKAMRERLADIRINVRYIGWDRLPVRRKQCTSEWFAEKFSGQR